MEINFYGAFAELSRRLHAIDAPARWVFVPHHSTVHPTHWLISTQAGTSDNLLLREGGTRHARQRRVHRNSTYARKRRTLVRALRRLLLAPTAWCRPPFHLRPSMTRPVNSSTIFTSPWSTNSPALEIQLLGIQRGNNKRPTSCPCRTGLMDRPPHLGDQRPPSLSVNVTRRLHSRPRSLAPFSIRRS